MEGIAVVVVEGIVDTVVDKGNTVVVAETVAVVVGGRDTVGGTVVGVGFGTHFGFSRI